jgi:hypothetical protein
VHLGGLRFRARCEARLPMRAEDRRTISCWRLASATLTASSMCTTAWNPHTDAVILFGNLGACTPDLFDRNLRIAACVKDILI